jgi:hypothetical protein
MDLKITEAYLNEITDYIGRSLCGKIMKKFEIIEDKTMLKSLIKETIYEEMRHFRDLVYAANSGLEMTQFHFKNSKEKV